MFDIGWSELLLIAGVAIVVVGPKEIPQLMRTVGQWMGKAQRMARHFQSGIDEMIRQADLDDVRKEISSINRDISGAIDPTRPAAKPAAPPPAPPVSPANPPAGAEP